MERVSRSVYRLGSSGHNFYTIVESGGATLIDAGCSREWAQLEEALDTLGLSFASLEGVVATHAHSDHFGLARRIHNEGVGVSVHRDEAPRANGSYSGRFAARATEIPFWRPRVVRNFLPMLRAGVMHHDFLEEVGLFSDGDRLDLPGRPQAIHTPGHTEGHTMFHLPDSGLLFTGDGLITMELLGARRGPRLIEPVFSLDHQQARSSLERIRDTAAETLLPGHGDPWFGSPAEAVAMALVA